MRTAVKLIAEHTYMLTDRLTGVNQFLLEGKEKALLIDTGYGTKSLPRVVEKLTSLPVMVVNTHLHPDHSNGNGFFGKVMVGEPDLPSHGVPSNYIFEGVASAYRKSLLRPLMSVARKFALIDPSSAEYSPMPDMIHLGERSLDAKKPGCRPVPRAYGGERDLLRLGDRLHLRGGRHQSRAVDVHLSLIEDEGLCGALERYARGAHVLVQDMDLAQQETAGY